MEYACINKSLFKLSSTTLSCINYKKHKVLKTNQEWLYSPTYTAVGHLE